MANWVHSEDIQPSYHNKILQEVDDKSCKKLVSSAVFMCLLLDDICFIHFTTSKEQRYEYMMCRCLRTLHTSLKNFFVYAPISLSSDERTLNLIW